MTQSRTDADSILWFCEGCEACGVVTLDADDQGWPVVAEIIGAHLRATPECTAAARVAKPRSWYRELVVDALERLQLALDPTIAAAVLETIAEYERGETVSMDSIEQGVLAQ